MRVHRVLLGFFPLLILLMGAGWILWARARPAKERAAMEEPLSLACGRTELIIGESTPLTVTIHNTTGQPLTLPDVQQSDKWPEIHVRDLQRQKETVFGPHSLEADGDYTPPVIPMNTTLAPGQQIKLQRDLLNWVSLPAPGSYELTAEIRWTGGAMTSSPLKLAVTPLRFRSVDIAGTHSGPGPGYYYVLSHDTGKGSALIVTCMAFDTHGHFHQTQALRVAETDHAAQPTLSVTANRLSYSAHWIVWLHEGHLHGLYESDGHVQVPAKVHALDVAGAALVAPAILDLHGNDGSKPGRGHVALWASGPNNARLAIRTFEADGSLKSGPEVTLPAGDLRSGRALALSSGECCYALAVQRGGAAHLDLVRWNPQGAAPSGPTRIAEWQGTILGAGIMVSEQDTLYGAALIKGRAADGRATYALSPWHVESGGAHAADPPILLQSDAALDFDRALVAVSRAGRAAALLRTPDRRWFYAGPEGVCRPLPAALAPYGEPVGIFGLYETTLMAALAGDQSGLTAQSLPIGGAAATR